MKARLMFADRDFQVRREEQPGELELIQDLGLTTLWKVMAAGDEAVFDSVRSALLSGLSTVEQVRYRQEIYADCLEQPAVVHELYDLATEAIAEKRKSWRGIGINSGGGEPLLHSSIQELEMFLGILRRLRRLTEEHAGEFRSEGFTRFFSTLRAELDDDYFAEVTRHLHNLRFRDGVLASAELGEESQGVAYVLRAPRSRGTFLRHATLKKPAFSRTIPRDDHGGHEALTALRNRVLSLAANVLSRSADHIGSFFAALHSELGFYLGCLNLHDTLVANDLPFSFPEPRRFGDSVLSASGLYDPCLTLHGVRVVHGNDIHAENKPLVIVTGANQGGKSTFLRSLGLAQLMMQAGMPIAARSFSAAIVERVFTHFAREEDVTMTSGKFDEELRRMSEIGRNISPHCLLLCNESFSTTNEREAAEIADEIIRAMLHADITVVFVTHLFELSRRFFEHQAETTLFLRAERGLEGERPFQLIEAEPLSTSYSKDLYARTFGASSAAVARCAGGERG